MTANTKVEPFKPTPLNTPELTAEQRVALDAAKADADLLAIVKAKADAEVTLTFGDGRYSNAMRELFKDSKRLLGLTEKQAEKLARSFGAELGKQNVNAKISYGRYSSKGNQITLKESATYKGLIVTFAIALGRLCVMLQDSVYFGYDAEKTNVALKDTYVEWLNK